MNVPYGAAPIGQVVRSPTTLATETEANDEEQGNGGGERRRDDAASGHRLLAPQGLLQARGHG